MDSIYFLMILQFGFPYYSILRATSDTLSQNRKIRKMLPVKIKKSITFEKRLFYK